MKRIAREFKYDGFVYRQIAREGDVAIYEQRWIKADGKESERVAYEVVRIGRAEAMEFPSGKKYPEREIYPRTEAWGVDGFTVTERDSAFAEMRMLGRKKKR